MFSNPVRIARFLGALVALLGGCAVVEPGAPVAAVNVRARSSFEVKEVVERVFQDAGYRTAGRTYDGMSFEKDGSDMDKLNYGNWTGGEVAKRARIVVVSKGDGRFRIRCTPFIVRDPNNSPFEDEHRRMQLFSPHYTHLLREVARELR